MLNNIGAAWDAQGEPGKALEYYEQALSIDKEVYSKRHPNVATDLNNIGSAWYALGDSQRANSMAMSIQIPERSKRGWIG
jgi:tetratricopeptide (TPR) repeat protein